MFSETVQPGFPQQLLLPLLCPGRPCTTSSYRCSRTENATAGSQKVVLWVDFFSFSFQVVLLMAEIPNNQLGYIKPCQLWDKLPTSTGAGFQSSTVFSVVPMFSGLRAFFVGWDCLVFLISQLTKGVVVNDGWHSRTVINWLSGFLPSTTGTMYLLNFQKGSLGPVDP